MVHRLFDQVPDQFIAEALSDTAVPGEYKLLFAPHADRQTVRIIEFPPPEPYVLSAVTAAIVHPSGKVIRPCIVTDHPNRRANTGRMIRAYDNSVGLGQTIALSIEIADAAGNTNILPNSTDPRFGHVATWAIEKTIAHQRRLVAAHVIVTTLRNNRVLDALAVPREFMEEFPLIVRAMFEPLAVDEGAAPLVAALPTHARTMLSEVMQGDPNTQILAIAAGASVLPDTDTFRQLA